MSAPTAPRSRTYGPASCSLANTLAVLGERWTFLVLREALAGTTRFNDFRSTLGIAAEVLSTRLASLVDAGVMVRHSYREPGQRARDSYHLTDPGRELVVVLGALQQWGDEHTPASKEPAFAFTTDDGRKVSVAFVDEAGTAVPAGEAFVRRTASHPLAGQHRS